jgi:hypothetical protein
VRAVSLVKIIFVRDNISDNKTKKLKFRFLVVCMELQDIIRGKKEKNEGMNNAFKVQTSKFMLQIVTLCP